MSGTQLTRTPTRAEIAAEAKKTPPGQLSPAAQMMIADRKAMNAVAREIANLTWGKNLGANVCQAIAEYGRRFHLDVVTEIEVLGGRIYRNAEYYIRRGAEMRREGLIRDVTVQHVHADPRLATLAKGSDAIAKEAEDELRRRQLLRIKHNVPEEATGAVVVTIVPTNGAAVTGANWAGSFGARKDPVGQAEPAKTAETRAFRRAWRHLIQTMPDLQAREDGADEDGKALSEVVRAEVRANVPEAPAALVEAPSHVVEEVTDAQLDEEDARLAAGDQS